MKKKYLAILMATLMTATMLSSIAMAEEETPPDDVEIPDSLPEEPLNAIKDDHPESGRGYPDLIVTNLGRQYHSSNETWEVWYRLYNNGDADIVDEDFTDKAWIYASGHWNGIAASEIDHTDFDLAEDTYSSYFNYYFTPVSGWHVLSQWTDIDDDVDEGNYENNNNYDRLWLWW